MKLNMFIEEVFGEQSNTIIDTDYGTSGLVYNKVDIILCRRKYNLLYAFHPLNGSLSLIISSNNKINNNLELEELYDNLLIEYSGIVSDILPVTCKLHIEGKHYLNIFVSLKQSNIDWQN